MGIRKAAARFVKHKRGARQGCETEADLWHSTGQAQLFLMALLPRRRHSSPTRPDSQIETRS